MTVSVQLNYMVNDMLTLAAFYDAENQKDTLFDVAGSDTADYEYRDQMRQAAGLRLIAEF